MSYALHVINLTVGINLAAVRFFSYDRRWDNDFERFGFHRWVLLMDLCHGVGESLSVLSYGPDSWSNGCITKYPCNYGKPLFS